MEKKEWNRTVDSLLEKCNLPENERRKQRKLFESIWTIRQYVTEERGKRLLPEDGTTLDELESAATDAAVCLAIHLASNKPVFLLDDETGSVSPLIMDSPIEQELRAFISFSRLKTGSMP